jgi:hypothetical protein
MSQQYPGGIITKNAVVPSGPYQDSTASGVWTLDQASQYVKAGNWPTFGNANPNLFIENLFSTWLYTGNGTSQTITNGIDLSTNGGLVWMKGRSVVSDHALYDTVRGTTRDLASNTTTAQTTQATGLTAFTTSGFTIGSLAKINLNADTFAAWTFREQTKFFDIVTWTGNGANRTIPHNLGSVPGCIIVKRTNSAAPWTVYHRSLANTQYVTLESTSAAITDTTMWNSTTPTSTQFSVGTSSNVNANTFTYVAYIFAHDAGGFGLSGTDNVISCGSYTSTTGSARITVTLGYEPQWILVKAVGSGSGTNWNMFDAMRGWPVNANGQSFRANTTAAETPEAWFTPTETGFIVNPGPNVEYNEAGGYRYIYIAIRRGPMKVPTTGTSVFSPSVYTTAPAIPLTVTTNFPVDLSLSQDIAGSVNAAIDRLRSVSSSGVRMLATQLTSVEASTTGLSLQNNTAIVDSGLWAGFAYKPVYWNFRRAPGFFDVVCYTGTGANRTINHNLTVVPELIIAKGRDIVAPWEVYSAALANTQYMVLNTTAAVATGATRWNSTTPTSSVFSLGTSTQLNTSGSTYVAYLFATAPGVSKVGSYTGNGSSQTIACGFTAGSRFVMIKRTNTTGDWYVWDSARGIVAGNDPHLSLNTSAAEVTTNDSVDTASTGFVVNQVAATNINVTSATYIFLAIS